MTREEINSDQALSVGVIIDFSCWLLVMDSPEGVVV